MPKKGGEYADGDDGCGKISKYKFGYLCSVFGSQALFILKSVSVNKDEPKASKQSQAIKVFNSVDYVVIRR